MPSDNRSAGDGLKGDEANRLEAIRFGRTVEGKFAALFVSDQANLSSFDHRQGSSNERPKDHGIKSLNDARLLCPS